MALRLEPNSIAHGSVCNREKGLTLVTLELADGRTVTAELQGNPYRDIAGRTLSFRHPTPDPKAHLSEALALKHHGQAGDITASRKVKVPTIPLTEIYKNPKYKDGNFPHVWKNSLYLEWYSRENGRVVLETEEFDLTVSDPVWTMSPAEESEAREQASQALVGFLNQLCDITPERKDNEKLFEKKDKLDEFDYEKELRFSDRMNDRYGELIDKFGMEDDAQIEALMGWKNPAKDKEPTKPDSFEPSQDSTPAWAEDPGDDWQRPEDHPLLKEAHNLLGDFTPGPDRSEEEQQVLFAVSMVSAKLAGALSCWTGEEFDDHAFTIARLKRVLSHIDTAVALADGLLTTKLLTLRQQIIDLQQQLRN